MFQAQVKNPLNKKVEVHQDKVTKELHKEKRVVLPTVLEKET
jgi:hypothetical protein